MDRLIKKHRKCTSGHTGHYEFRCDCPYYVAYHDWRERNPKKRNKRKSTRTANKRRAEQFMREFLLNLGRSPLQHTKISAALEWAQLAAATPNTAEVLGRRTREVMAVIGDISLQELTRKELTEFVESERQRITQYGRPPKESTIRLNLQALRTLIRVAREEHQIEGLPDIGVIQPKLRIEPRHERIRTRILSFEEAEMLLEYWAHKPERQAWIAMALYTGAEKSAIPRMGPDALIDQISGRGITAYINVRGTKKEGRNRLVPVGPTLKEWLDSGVREMLPLPPWRHAAEKMTYACEKLGIPKATPHDLRRTFCSWQLIAGHPRSTVAKMMGHSSTRMVEEVYSQIFPDAAVAAVASLHHIAPPARIGEPNNAQQTNEHQPTPDGQADKKHACRAHGVRAQTLGTRPVHLDHGIGRHAFAPERALWQSAIR
jgi:integrase